MSTRDQLIERGKKLAEKYSIPELKDALKNAVMINDNEERLSLQYAIKTKTGESSGYKYTREIQAGVHTKLAT